MALFATKSIAPMETEDPELLYSLDEHEDFVICKSPGKLKSLLYRIAENKSVHYWSDGDWSMHDMIMELLKRHKPAELFISTYALRELAVRQIIMAQDRGEIASVHMLLDYRAPVRIPEVVQLASMNVNKIGMAKVHAKVFILRGPTASISIITSANLTSNPRIECGVVSTNRDLADFHISTMQKLIDNAEIFI